MMTSKELAFRRLLHASHSCIDWVVASHMQKFPQYLDEAAYRNAYRNRVVLYVTLQGFRRNVDESPTKRKHMIQGTIKWKESQTLSESHLLCLDYGTFSMLCVSWLRQTGLFLNFCLANLLPLSATCSALVVTATSCFFRFWSEHRSTLRNEANAFMVDCQQFPILVRIFAGRFRRWYRSWQQSNGLTSLTLWSQGRTDDLET